MTEESNAGAHESYAVFGTGVLHLGRTRRPAGMGEEPNPVSDGLIDVVAVGLSAPRAVRSKAAWERGETCGRPTTHRSDRRPLSFGGSRVNSETMVAS
jgi:hypothetical protein